MSAILLRTLVCAATLALFNSPSARSESIFPPQLEGKKSIELGELVLLLMPDRGAQFVDWDHRANSMIVWVTDAYGEDVRSDGSSLYFRDGVVRSHIQGHVAQVLKNRKLELGWTVSYINRSVPKHGVVEIEIRPGTPRDQCFGSRYDGCTFEAPLASLGAAGVKARAICRKRLAGNSVAAYELSHVARRPTVMMWVESGGSGGASASIDLLLDKSPLPSLCSERLPDFVSTDQAKPEAATASRPISRGAPNPASNGTGLPPSKPLTFDFDEMRIKATFEQLDAGMASCMRSGSLAMLMRGVRDREAILAFTEGACGTQVRRFLITAGHVTEDVASAYVRASAERELISVPGVR